MYKYFCGFDNGVTGSIGIVGSDGSFICFESTPVILQQDYTKSVKKIHRIDVKELEILIKDFLKKGETIALIERPMVNSLRFNATLSAVRALEATLIVLEKYSISYSFVDSKEWQKHMLPAGIWKPSVSKKGKSLLKADPGELKKASKDVASRMFPTAVIFNDADGLLIAEYCRRKQLGQV